MNQPPHHPINPEEISRSKRPMNVLNRAATKILVVDDDPEVLRSTARLLEKEGYAVNRAADGEEALRSVRTDHPALLLLDRSLPGIDGLEVCRRIKQDPALADIFVVIISGKKIESTDQAEGLETGADDYIARPIANRELLARVEANVRIVVLTRSLRRQAETIKKNSGALEAQAASLNLMEDAVEAQNRLLAVNQELRSEIAERKRAEEDARIAHERLHRLLDANVVGVAVGTSAGGIVEANDYFLRLIGYSREEFEQGKINWLALTPPEWHASEAEAIRELREKGTHPPFEKEYFRRDGTRVPVLIVGTILPGPEEQLAAFVLDLTERKQAETALRASEEKFRSLFESSQDAIMTLEPPAWRFTSGNAATVKMFGARNQEEIISRASWELSPERQPDGCASAEKSKEMIETVVREGSHHFEWTHRRIGGGEFPADVLLTRMEQGGKVVVQATVRDITARKLAEHQLREQNEILTNAHEGVIIVNLDHQVTLWNRGAERMFGWTAAEALGHPPDHVLGDGNPGVVSTLHAAVERDGFWNGEMRAQTRDGRTLILDCRTTLVRDAAGRPRARLTFFADITEKKLLEEKFLHAQRLESLGMLAAGIAHDLNNVLAPIMFAAPMLRDSLATERDLKILDTLEQNAGRGAGLVKQILGFARSTSGEFQATQVKHIVRDVANMIEETFPKSIQLESMIPSDPWPVQCNPTQIHQVLLNLCVNARDAMPQGGKLGLTAANCRLDVAEAGAIAGGRPGDWLVLTVSDTGTGIPPEVLEKIWTPFFTTKGVGKGTGLGLTTIRSIATTHKGFITLETAVGKGTTFRVFLPAAEGAVARKKSASPFAGQMGNGELILVVDDDAAIHNLVAAILGKFGYRVLKCLDGVEAIELFKGRPDDFALVITDEDMPRMGGLVLANTMLQMRPDLRILAISGIPLPDAATPDIPTIRSVTHGFLLKPFTAEELLATVHQILHQAEKGAPS